MNLYIVLGSFLGICFGILVPFISNKVILYKEKKKGKSYEKWNINKGKGMLYSIFTVAAWVALAVYYPGWKMFYLGIVLTAAIIAAYIDSRCRILPNEIVLLVLLAGFLYQVVNEGIAGIGSSLLGMTVGGGVFFLSSLIVRKSGAVGAGDVKYMLAAGALVGFPGVLSCMVMMAVCLLVYCVVGLIVKKLTLYSYFAMGVFISFGLVMSFFSQQMVDMAQTVF